MSFSGVICWSGAGGSFTKVVQKTFWYGTKSKDHDLSVVLHLTVYVSMVCFPKIFQYEFLK